MNCAKEIFPEWMSCLKDHLAIYFTDIPSNAWTDQMLNQVLKKMCPVGEYSPENIKLVQELRIPMIMTGALLPPPSWKERVNILKAAGVKKHMKGATFNSKFFSPYTIPDIAGPKVAPVTLLGDLGFNSDDWTSKFAQFSLRLTADWNGLLYTRESRNLSEYSVVLSQEKAWSKAHKHPFMFFNYAFNGFKSYVLYDSTKGDRFNRLTVSTRSLKWQEFLADPSAYFAYIDGNTANNFIAVPAWYSHDVYTCAGRGIYVGMLGFGISNDLHDAAKILYDASNPLIMPRMKTVPSYLTEEASKAWTTET